tara:strand:- start:180 stop:554 length:375 start_codon:yes stop_codon:yes gene_type:complete
MITVIVKLTSGETVLARQSYRSNDKITIVDPLKIEFITDFNGPAMHSTYWIPLTNEEISIDIDMSHVILSVQAPIDLAEFYSKSIVQVKNDNRQDQKNLLQEKVKDAIKQVSKYHSNTSNWTVH